MQLKIMFCPKCGNDIESGSSYCKNCGAKIESTPQSAYQAGVPPQYIPPPQKFWYCSNTVFYNTRRRSYLRRSDWKGAAILYHWNYRIIATIMLLPFIVVFLIFWVWQIYDAYNITEEYNQILQTTGQKPW